MDLKAVSLTEPQAAWLAAAIDGEGSISFYLKNDSHSNRIIIEPHVEIYNTSKPFLEKAKQITECGNIYKYGRNCFTYRANSANTCRQILEQIFPFLIIKRFQARKVLQFCLRDIGKYTLKDLHIYEAIKRANWHAGPLLESEKYKKLKIQLENGGD